MSLVRCYSTQFFCMYSYVVGGVSHLMDGFSILIMSG